MTEYQFDTYKFSINTEIKLDKKWFKITEINFGDRKIGITNGQLFHYTEIDGIKN